MPTLYRIMICKTWQLAALNCVLELQESTSRLGTGVRGLRVVFVRLFSLLLQTTSLCTASEGEKNPAEQSLRHSGCSTLVGACGSCSICRAQNWQLFYIYAHTGIQDELLFEVMFLLFVYVWSFSMWPEDWSRLCNSCGFSKNWTCQ